MSTAYPRTVYRASLSGKPSGREPQKRLSVIADDDPTWSGVRLHIESANGRSLASIGLDNDQIILLGDWLRSVADAGHNLTEALASGRFTSETRQS